MIWGHDEFRNSTNTFYPTYPVHKINENTNKFLIYLPCIIALSIWRIQNSYSSEV